MLVSLALLMVCSGVTAAPVRVACSEGHCEEFDIVKRNPSALELMEPWCGPECEPGSRGRSFFARARRRRPGYVFCSTRRPALISTENELTAAVMLAPLSDWEYDKALSKYLVYFEVCHSAGSAVAAERAGLARRLGYTVRRLNASGPLELTRPESIFYFHPLTAAGEPASCRHREQSPASASCLRLNAMLSGKRLWLQRYPPRHWPDEMSWLIAAGTAAGILLALVALHVVQLLV